MNTSEFLQVRPSPASDLEVGATHSKKCLLQMPQLANASERIGINLTGPHDCDGFKIVGGNANTMPQFADDHFDLVLCNAVIEHDKFFWKTVAEIKRVTKPGGMIVIGAPGYRVTWLDKLQRRMERLPLLKHLRHHRYLNMLFTATVTFKVHDAPGDYYRYSPQAFRDVIMEGLERVEVRSCPTSAKTDRHWLEEELGPTILRRRIVQQHR